MPDMPDSSLIIVGIGGFAIARSPARLKTSGLGSCVGVTIYDRKERIGGLVHAMLPSAKGDRLENNPAKYADSGIVYIIEEAIKTGASRKRLEAKIVGGASMFPNTFLNIGERNIKCAKKTLVEFGIPIVADDTGKNYGRTIILDTSTGILYVKSALYGCKEI